MKRTFLIACALGFSSLFAAPLVPQAAASDCRAPRYHHRHQSHHPQIYPHHYNSYPRSRSGVVLQFNLNPAPVYRPAPSPRYVSAGSVVADVQRALNQRGYMAGYVDGVFGQRTEAAIRQYQYDHRLAVTGEINQTLLRSLRLQ
jgi:hypothetical protein